MSTKRSIRGDRGRLRSVLPELDLNSFRPQFLVPSCAPYDTRFPRDLSSQTSSLPVLGKAAGMPPSTPPRCLLRSSTGGGRGRPGAVRGSPGWGTGLGNTVWVVLLPLIWKLRPLPCNEGRCEFAVICRNLPKYVASVSGGISCSGKPWPPTPSLTSWRGDDQGMETD